MAKKKNVKHILGGGFYGGYRGDILRGETSEKVARKMTGGHVGANAVTWSGWADHMEGGPAPYTNFNPKMPGTNKHRWPLDKKKITRESSMKKFPQAQQAQVASRKRGYVSSYLDLSANKPGKYGVDY